MRLGGLVRPLRLRRPLSVPTWLYIFDIRSMKGPPLLGLTDGPLAAVPDFLTHLLATRASSRSRAVEPITPHGQFRHRYPKRVEACHRRQTSQANALISLVCPVSGAPTGTPVVASHTSHSLGATDSEEKRAIGIVSKRSHSSPISIGEGSSISQTSFPARGYQIFTDAQGIVRTARTGRPSARIPKASMSQDSSIPFSARPIAPPVSASRSCMDSSPIAASTSRPLGPIPNRSLTCVIERAKGLPTGSAEAKSQT